MTRGVNIADLAALSNDAALVADQEITAIEVGAHRRRTQNLINGLLTALRDKESCYAGGGEPISKKQGKMYLDTDDSRYKGYSTSAGTPTELLESGSIYAEALSTAGTDTIRLGGVIEVDSESVDALTWEQVGPGNAIATVGTPALAALSATRVAFIDQGNAALRTYDFDGANWAQVGPGNAIATVGAPALAALSATRVAFIDSTNDALRTYDFDGTNWAQVGNSLAIATMGVPALAALSATRVAFIDSGNMSLRAYDFDGTNWVQVGNSLAIATVGTPALAELSATRVAFIDSSNDALRTYDFDGTNWAQVGNSLAIATVGFPALAALSSTRVAFIDTSNDALRAYDFDGTDWAQVGNSLAIATVGFPALAALSSTRIALVDSNSGALRTYDFDGTNWAQVGPDNAIAAVGEPALAALSATRVAFIDGNDDALRTYSYERYLLPASTLSSNEDVAALTAFGTKTGTAATLTITPRLESENVASHIASASAAAWLTETVIVRTGAATQKAVSLMRSNRDDSGATSLVGTAALTGDPTAALEMFVLLAPGSTDSAAREGRIVEYSG